MGLFVPPVARELADSLPVPVSNGRDLAKAVGISYVRLLIAFPIEAGRGRRRCKLTVFV